MKITIENCNNIDNGTIEIEPGCLNIKYACNGTGKSTIAKAIHAFATTDADEQKSLIPYSLVGKRTGPRPTVTGLENIKSVERFDEAYVNQFLFIKDKASKKDILLNDAFSIFVKTPEYDKNMKRITGQLQKITQEIQGNEDLNNVINLLERFVKKCGTGTKVAKNSAIEKSLSTGNLLADVAPQFKAYESFLQDRTDFKNAKWVGWASDGQAYIKDNRSCPFCLSTNNQKNFETIKEISQQYTQKSLEELTDVLQSFHEIADYLDDDSKTFLQKLEADADGLDADARNTLSTIKEQVCEILGKFNALRSINALSVDDIDNLLADVQSKKINLDGMLFGPKMNAVVDKVNEAFDKIYQQAQEIKNDIVAQTELISSTVNTNKKRINDFLRTAGYNYEVDIHHENGNANIFLLPSGLSAPVDNAKDHLSYGERNAFAMVLFIFAAIKKNPDLIVLDDPISSFDGNKKFALLKMMFLPSNPDNAGEYDEDKPALLNGRTVLLLTHDFTTVLDIVHTLYMCFPKTNAHVLTNKKGSLKEQAVSKSDFRSFRSIAISMIKSQDNSIITKVIYLRRLLDFLGEKDETPYHLLSSLFHCREKPTIVNGSYSSEMSEQDIQNATQLIKNGADFPAHITDFDYKTILNIIRDDNRLKEIYKGSCDYEKIHIFCMYMRRHKADVHDVLQKFTNEFFHIENDSIYQLDPTKFSLIPQHIIAECDKIMGCEESSSTNS